MKNQKGFANVVLIAVAAALLLAGYFVFVKENCRLRSSPDVYECGSYFSHFMNSFSKPVSINPTEIPNVAKDETVNWKTNSISSVYIYGPELNKVKVFLYALDEKKTIATTSYCGSAIGSEIYNGNYKLIVDPNTATSDNPGGNSDLMWKSSTLDIGSMEFVKNTAWDGKLIVDQFDPIGYKNFIILNQYGSCNLDYMRIYGYDFSQGKLIQYKFIQKNGSFATDLLVNVGSGFKKYLNGELITSAYNNVTGKTEITEWIFDSSKNAFMVK